MIRFFMKIIKVKHQEELVTKRYNELVKKTGSELVGRRIKICRWCEVPKKENPQGICKTNYPAACVYFIVEIS